MVIKGKARGGPVALATHLERRDTNERVTILELRGVTSRDVLGALREMDCMGAGAASTRTLYHAAVNTAPNEYLTAEQKQMAADRLEKELGFEGQPRIIVEHFKKDREHMHVVFLRIDTDRMVAIPDSHNYRKHEIVARDLERAFGHEHVQGVHIGREGQQRSERTPYHHEMQQAERTGLTPQQAKAQITQLWKQADNGKAFASSLEAEGWVLAQGDKRDFVLVDRTGGSHSLARRVDGAKAVDIRERLSDVDPATLPTVTEAKEQQRSRQSEAGRAKEKQKSKAPDGLGLPPRVLKIEQPASRAAAEPLVITGAKARTIEKKSEPEKTVRRQRAKPTEETREPNRMRQLYDAALERAKAMFQGRKREAHDNTQARTFGPSMPAQQSTQTKELTRAQLEMAKKREAAKAMDRHLLSSDREKHNPLLERERTPTPDRKAAKLSREERDMLWERQRRERERGGPGR